jgi:hypothetical protein
MRFMIRLSMLMHLTRVIRGKAFDRRGSSSFSISGS